MAFETNRLLLIALETDDHLTTVVPYSSLGLNMAALVPKPENLASLVYIVRGERVLLDADLAELYGVSTRALNQAVKRNVSRFPADFMFQVSLDEWSFIRSQTVTSS